MAKEKPWPLGRRSRFRATQSRACSSVAPRRQGADERYVGVGGQFHAHGDVLLDERDEGRRYRARAPSTARRNVAWAGSPEGAVAAVPGAGSVHRPRAADPVLSVLPAEAAPHDARSADPRLARPGGRPPRPDHPSAPLGGPVRRRRRRRRRAGLRLHDRALRPRPSRSSSSSGSATTTRTASSGGSPAWSPTGAT